MPRSRRAPAAALLLASALALAACSGPVSGLEAAPEANNPSCADVIVRLPGVVDGKNRRWTDAQSTGAWGDPTAVILTCGVEPPGPTEEKCISIGGVDWIVDESEAPRYRITTYGRTPAVQIYADNEVVSPNEVLTTLGPIVAILRQTGQCTSTETLVP